MPVDRDNVREVESVPLRLRPPHPVDLERPPLNPGRVDSHTPGPDGPRPTGGARYSASTACLPRRTPAARRNGMSMPVASSSRVRRDRSPRTEGGAR